MHIIQDSLVSFFLRSQWEITEKMQDRGSEKAFIKALTKVKKDGCQTGQHRELARTEFSGPRKHGRDYDATGLFDH